MSKPFVENFIVCPKCNGSGRKQININCINCRGIGVGVFLKNKFLFWGMRINKITILARYFKKNIDLFINIIAFAISLLGLFSLGYWFFKASNIGNFEAFLFWREKHWLITFFWFSVIADMFIYYRLSMVEALKSKINKIKINNENIPNNWIELNKYNNKLDISKYYSEEVIKIIEKAFLYANKVKSSKVVACHLFLFLLENKKIIEFFIRLNVNIKDLKEKISRINIEIDTNYNYFSLDLSIESKEILIKAYIGAYNLNQKDVNPINLLLPCFRNNIEIKEILLDFGINEDKMKNTICWFKFNDQLIENYKIYRKMAKYKSDKTMDKAYTAIATPVLNHFSYDLTAMAKLGKLEFCVSREEEIKRIFENFESGRTGVILTGYIGVGKESVVHAIAQLMVKEDVPKFLKDKRLIELDIARFISGLTPAQAEERLLIIVDEISRARNIILYIKDIENIVGITSGEEQSLELSEVLANAIERKNLFCVATATRDNYSKYIEERKLGSVIAIVTIDEPDVNQAIQILESKIGLLETKHKVYFTYNAIEDAVKLSKKYINNKYLPEKAINIVIATTVRLSKQKNKKNNLIMCSRNDIADEVSKVSKIPVSSITENEIDKLMNLESLIHKDIVNQNEAVDIVSNSIRRARVDIREGKRPIASFLFLGPTGVGKTELAKIVSKIYFKGEQNMIRLDMSEYQHQDSIKKILGDAQGVLGFLTELVRKKPFALILLDEFEKAHFNILNLFLQVMDDGRLTDGQGRTIDFTNTIIIATSNLGSLYIQKEVSKGDVDMAKIKEILINEYINKVLSPELINRFDGIVVFKPLSKDNVIDIVNLMLNKIKKMLEKKGMFFEASKEAIKKIAEEGYDPKFGARPLRRLIQEKVENKIANKIISNKLERRDIVVVDESINVNIQKGREL